MKQKTLWLGISGVLVVVTVIALAGKYPREKFESQAFGTVSGRNDPALATQDMSLVHIDTRYRRERVQPVYGDTSYAVPKAYLDEPKYWRGGEFEAFTVDASLPDMKPSSIYAEELYKNLMASPEGQQPDVREAARTWHDKTFHNSVLIKVGYGNCFGISRSQPEYLAQWGKVDVTYTDPMFQKIDLHTARNSNISTLVPRQQEGLAAYIHCTQFGDLRTRCTATTDYDALVSLEVTFSQRYLSNYKEILAKSRALVGSFITSNKPTAVIPAECLKDVKVK